MTELSSSSLWAVREGTAGEMLKFYNIPVPLVSFNGVGFTRRCVGFHVFSWRRFHRVLRSIPLKNRCERTPDFFYIRINVLRLKRLLWCSYVIILSYNAHYYSHHFFVELKNERFRRKCEPSNSLNTGHHDVWIRLFYIFKSSNTGGIQVDFDE